ncbi:MAG: NMD3-related protein [Candidatus Woesearchaeota archaeon]
MSFCPKCGKKGIKGVLCSECALKEAFVQFKDIKLKACINCRSCLFRNKWTRFSSLDDAVRKVVEKSLKSRASVKVRPFLPEMEWKPGLSYDFEVEVEFSPNERYYLPARIEMTLCPKCGKKGTEYFEGVLQLRNPSQEAVDFIRNEVRKQNDKGVHITNEIKRENGIDFYLTSQKHLQNLGKRLQDRFGGALKINPELYSRDRQTSREIHRINVLFEMLDFKVGDAVSTGSKMIRITEIGRKSATGHDLRTGKKTSFDYRKQDYNVLDRIKTRIVKMYPHMEVLHPETYQDIRVLNSRKTLKDLKADDEVEAVIADDGAYII